MNEQELDVRGYYIPQVVNLPGGFTIRVRQLKPMQMKAAHGDDYDAIWDLDNMRIDLKKTLSRQRKWYVFGHELAHAVNDWQHWMVNTEMAKG